MSWRRILRLISKTPEERTLTLHYFIRRGLSKLPYLPVSVQFRIPPADQVKFWWSYVPPDFHPDRQMREYWGQDTGELRFLWRFLHPGMTFLDVGAYHGIYAVIAAKRVGSQGWVVAFEPSPRDLLRLNLHIKMNRLSRVSVEPLAVAGGSGESKFYVTADDPTMNSLRRPVASGPVREICVNSVTLDQYCAGKGIEPQLIKVDAEGGELEIFAGARRLLTGVRPLWICEVLDLVTRPWGYPAREIPAALKVQGYEWFEFRADGEVIPHQGQHDYPAVRNYLAVPMEKRALIEDLLWKN